MVATMPEPMFLGGKRGEARESNDNKHENQMIISMRIK